MYKDDIIHEVWANRKAFSEKHNHNIDSMINDLMSRQAKSTHDIVDRRSIPNKERQPTVIEK